MDPIIGGIASSLIGGLFSSSAADSAAAAQQAADAARLEEEKRVREQLRQDTEAQRAIADQAFADYQSGLLTYAQAQEKAAQAMQGVQSSIAQSQLSDAAKATAMAEFKPYAITSGTGKSFFDTATGQAGYTLAPELQQYQQGLYGKAGEAARGIATSPEAAAQQFMQQQQSLLQPGREAEDLALRSEQLQRGRIGLGISSEAAGAGAGGMVNPEQFARERARAQADAAIAAGATQAGQAQAANQLQLAQGLFGAGAAPEKFGLDVMTQGAGLGEQATRAGAAQAALYSAGMGDYYRSLLGAAQTGQEGALFTPAAQQTGTTEAYQRQQQYLTNLQGNNLPYQPMTTAQPIIPGSAYAGAAFGSSLGNIGMGMLSDYLRPQQQQSINLGRSSIPSSAVSGDNFMQLFNSYK